MNRKPSGICPKCGAPTIWSSVEYGYVCTNFGKCENAGKKCGSVIFTKESEK
jgi:ssDNA-binding Zn-finger/Zn-ribbon topoisomerase 1